MIHQEVLSVVKSEIRTELTNLVGEIIAEQDVTEKKLKKLTSLTSQLHSDKRIDTPALIQSAEESYQELARDPLYARIKSSAGLEQSGYPDVDRAREQILKAKNKESLCKAAQNKIQ